MATVLKRPNPVCRPAQGDIYTDISVPIVGQVEINAQGETEVLEADIIVLDYVVVLSQECDLEQDYTDRERAIDVHDKYVQTVLIAPAYLAENLRAGEHLAASLGQKMQKINSDMWKIIKNNKNERYHFIDACVELNVPELVIDFKHMYTLSRTYFYQSVLAKKYYASLAYLSRELLSQRFCNFLSRIGLPDKIDELDAHFCAMRSATSI